MTADDLTKGGEVEDEKDGTPQVTVCGFDLEWPREMYSVQFVRYDLNQLRAVSLSPVVRWSQFKRMPWSTVSNAAERSRRMRREGEPASDDMRRSFVTDKGSLCAVGRAET